MTSYKVYFFVTIMAILGSNQGTSAQEKPDVTDVCLGCICQAMSGCDFSLQCEGDVCGAFKITWPYWADAGKPTLQGEANDSPTAFKNCVTDPYCAGSAVRGYMAKYGQDCNKDGIVNCYDHMAIHKRGGFSCSGELPFQYVSVFNQCIDAVSKHQPSS